jgi:hypothetical protein
MLSALATASLVVLRSGSYSSDLTLPVWDAAGTLPLGSGRTSDRHHGRELLSCPPGQHCPTPDADQIDVVPRSEVPVDSHCRHSYLARRERRLPTARHSLREDIVLLGQ